MRISDWSSDVCSSDLVGFHDKVRKAAGQQPVVEAVAAVERQLGGLAQALEGVAVGPLEHLGRGREQRRGRQLGTGPCPRLARALPVYEAGGMAGGADPALLQDRYRKSVR